MLILMTTMRNKCHFLEREAQLPIPIKRSPADNRRDGVGGQGAIGGTSKQGFATATSRASRRHLKLLANNTNTEQQDLTKSHFMPHNTGCMSKGN